MTSLAVLAPVLRATPVNTAPQALAVMQGIEQALLSATGQPSDGVAWFNRLYMTVTADMVKAIADQTFEQPEFVARLDTVFANLYFKALCEFSAASALVPRAWWPLFSERERTDVAPLQFAFAGMNAHVNRDLPVALTELWQMSGVSLPPPDAQKRDYERVNEVLAAVETRSKAWFLTEAWQQALSAFHGVDDVVAVFSVAEARDAAWVQGEVLLSLGGPPTRLGGAYLEAFDGVVGLASRGLLVRTKTS